MKKMYLAIMLASVGYAAAFEPDNNLQKFDDAKKEFLDLQRKEAMLQSEPTTEADGVPVQKKPAVKTPQEQAIVEEKPTEETKEIVSEHTIAENEVTEPTEKEVVVEPKESEEPGNGLPQSVQEKTELPADSSVEKKVAEKDTDTPVEAPQEVVTPQPQTKEKTACEETKKLDDVVVTQETGIIEKSEAMPEVHAQEYSNSELLIELDSAQQIAQEPIAHDLTVADEFLEVTQSSENLEDGMNAYLLSEQGHDLTLPKKNSVAPEIDESKKKEGLVGGNALPVDGDKSFFELFSFEKMQKFCNDHQQEMLAGVVALVLVSGVVYVLYKNGTLKKLSSWIKENPKKVVGVLLVAICAGVAVQHNVGSVQTTLRLPLLLSTGCF